ncbi:MAG: gluconate 2-dehydrogenase subunit 3 family protein [Myxococcales bacterium]|nr:gluconate 2-dehydrogenase subunit 3 family protein [Myxococcales bacterium]
MTITMVRTLFRGVRKTFHIKEVAGRPTSQYLLSMPITRRQLLAATTACATLAGAGGVLAHLPAPAPGRVVLSDEETQVVAALADALFPPGNPIGVAGSAVNVAAELDRMLGEDLDPVVAPVFRHLLRGLEFGSVATHGGRFSRLERPVREEILTDWSASGSVPRRMAYDVLKTCVGWAWFNAPAVRAGLGWQSDCHVGAA